MCQDEEAWDVAAAFGALRTDYPDAAVSLDRQARVQIDALLTPEAAAKYEQRDVTGLPPLWAHYYDFEVERVVEIGDGRFAAVILLDRGGTVRERLTIGPGVAVDGHSYDFVVLNAEVE